MVSDTGIVSGPFGEPDANTVIVPFSAVAPPMTLPGLTTAAVNWPLAMLVLLVIDSHGTSAVAPHALAAPANVTVTSCGAVTNVRAPPAPFFAAPNVNDAGLRVIAP